MEAISPSMRNGIAAGIGLFIAFIGLQLSSLVTITKGAESHAGDEHALRFARPDRLFLRLVGHVACLQARRVRGAILWGILAGGATGRRLETGLPYARRRGDEIEDASPNRC